jgi:type IX secretion system PorP/SprF family membrane protein
MKKNYIFIVAFFLFVTVSNGQQLPQYSLYMLSPYATNPAVAGVSDHLEAAGTVRSQWLNLDGAPNSQSFQVMMPINIISSGIGLNFESDGIGAYNTLNLKGTYNYITKIGDGSLSFGASFGITQLSLDGAKLITPDGNYNQGVIDHRDQILPTGSVSSTAPVFGAGVYYKAENWSLGAGGLNVTGSKLNNFGTKNFSIALKQQYFITFATQFNITRDLVLHPSVLLKSDMIENQTDLSAFVQYDNNIFLGTSFRGYNKNTSDALVMFAGFNLNSSFKIAYAYDFTLSSLNSVSAGSHEFTLLYKLDAVFGKGKLPPIIYNPRFK